MFSKNYIPLYIFNKLKKLLKLSIYTLLILFTLIPAKTTAGSIDSLFIQNSIAISEMLYEAWSEGNKNSVKAIEFTVSQANDIALTLSYANVRDKTRKYKFALFKLLYAEDNLASASLNKNFAKKNFKKAVNVESSEFASNKMAQEKYKSTLYLYEKALKNKEIELKAFENTKARYDRAIDHFVKIQQTTKQNI